MDRDELIRLIAFLRERLEEAEAARKKEHEESSERISALTSEVSGLNRRVGELSDMLKASYVSASETAMQMSELLRQLKDKDRKIAELQSTAKVARKNMSGSKSQKGTKAKGRDNGNGPTPHTDVKDGFDGTPESLPADLDVDVKNDTAAANPPSATQKESRLNRIGMTYRTMNADNHVLYRSDKSRLPEGATFIKTANERKNSLFFGSDRMARVSAAYHSVVSTCRLQGYSILEYLKKFFAEIVAGNRDYGKLMPSTIGISANKI